MKAKAVEKDLKHLRALLREREAQGMLDSGQVETVAKALRKIEHAVATRNLNQLTTAIDDLARAFCKVF